MSTGGIDVLQVLFPLRVQFPEHAIRQDLGEADDGVQWRPQLVGHVRQEFRLVLTFRDYLLKVRLERAKVLLASGHVSITEVAHDVGFSDLARFDKVFKRYTGFTPSAYRSSNRIAINTKDSATNY